MTEPDVSVHENSQRGESQTKIRREFDQSMSAADAVALTVTEAIDQWPELIDRPVLGEVIALSQLDGLFERSPTGSVPPHPTVEFRYQHCDVTVYYGISICVTIDRRQ